MIIESDIYKNKQYCRINSPPLKNNTLLAGVVYKGVEPFLSNYFDSIKQQTDKNFDVFIVNDGLDEEKIEKHQEGVVISLIKEKQTIAQIRQRILEYAFENKYDNLIFSDADDYFSANRVEVSKKYLKDYDFVFTELDLVDEHNRMIFPRFLSSIVSPDLLEDFKVLLDKNIVGMGNSAVKLKKIEKIDIPDDIIAVDWYFYSCLLLKGCIGKFIRESHTFYRQHNDNLIGMKSSLNSDKLAFGIEVKKKHYEKVKDFCEENGLKIATVLCCEKMDEIKKLEDKLRDNTFEDTYLKVINDNYSKIFSGWWSEVLTLNEYEKYAN